MNMTFHRIEPPHPDDEDPRPVHVRTVRDPRPLDPVCVVVWGIAIPLMTLAWIAAILWVLFVS